MLTGDNEDDNNESVYILVTNYPEKKISISLTWKDLTYTVQQDKQSIQILKGVSGFANPGEMLAIMGSSGSGKTILLSMLSNQLIPQHNVKVSGSVEINNINIKSLDYSSFTKYALQQDILFPTLTAREALYFSARLKVPGSNEFLTEKIKQLLDDLSLTNVADNFIGNEYIKGLSGGEKRLLCVGIELISEPSILILDEPTSGLDCIKAELVINLLKEQANKNKTIILTIHQPSATIFNSFNRLILISEGNFVYQGDIALSIKYFNKIGFTCPELKHPPDYFMKILYVADRNNFTEEERNKINIFIEKYKKNEAQTLSERKINDLLTIDSKINAYHASILIEIQELLKRAFKNSFRNPLLFYIKLARIIVTGVLIDLLFNNLGYDTRGVKNREGFLFFLTINLVVTGSSSTAMTFPIERPLFIKHYKEGSYGVCSYLLSKIIAELPIQILFIFIYVIIYYFALGLNLYSARNFFIHYGLALLAHIIGCGYGYLAGALSKDVVAATQLGPIISSPLMIFGGYFSNNSSLSKAFYWIKYLSVYNYCFTGFVINEFNGLQIDSDIQSPLKSLNIDNSTWQIAGCMLLIEFIIVIITLIVMKLDGESQKSRLL